MLPPTSRWSPIRQNNIALGQCCLPANDIARFKCGHWSKWSQRRNLPILSYGSPIRQNPDVQCVKKSVGSVVCVEDRFWVVFYDVVWTTPKPCRRKWERYFIGAQPQPILFGGTDSTKHCKTISGPSTYKLRESISTAAWNWPSPLQSPTRYFTSPKFPMALMASGALKGSQFLAITSSND